MPESSATADYDGAKKRQVKKENLVIETPDHLLALHAIPATEQHWAQARCLRADLQAATGEHTAEAVTKDRIQLEAVKIPKAKRGCLLIAAQGSELCFCWTGRLLRPARDFRRLGRVLNGTGEIDFAILYVKRLVEIPN